MSTSSLWLTPSLLESISDGFVFVDRELRYVFVNQAAERLLLRSRDELIGRRIWDVFERRPNDPLAASIDEAIRTGRSTHVEGLNAQRGVWFDLHTYPSESGLTILFRDITELKQKEVALRASETRFRVMSEELRATEEQLSFLAEASTLLATSLDYEQTLRHVSDLMVPRLADWCAVDVFDESGELVRVAVSHVNPTKVQWARQVARRYPDEAERPYTMAYVARTGQPVLIPEISDQMITEAARDEDHLELIRQVGFRSVMVVPLQARERTLGAIMMVWAETEANYTESDLRFAQDLAHRAASAVDNARLYREARLAESNLRHLNETLEERVRERTRALEAEVRERTTAEQALAHAVAQLEERNRDLQDFASVVSHDLQEPLRKIIAFSDLIREEYDPVVNEEGRHYLGRVQDAARRMARLIQDLLAYSRLAAGGERIEKVDLNKILAGVLSDLELRIKDAGGKVDTDLLPEIEADATQMRQLFQNLIGNALKFHRPGVPPHIRIKSTLQAEVKGQVPLCHLEVHDNGIGFEQRRLDEIFMPFKRLHSRQEYPGTGIGLAICKRIVERHNGLITARSQPGEGSTFTIVLPLYYQAPPSL